MINVCFINVQMYSHKMYSKFEFVFLIFFFFAIFYYFGNISLRVCVWKTLSNFNSRGVYCFSQISFLEVTWELEKDRNMCSLRPEDMQPWLIYGRSTPHVGEVTA